MSSSSSSVSPILIFGATGGVGSEIIHQLLTKTVPVTAAVRDINKANKKLPSQVNRVQVELNDLNSIKEAVRSSQAKKVFLYFFGAKAEVLTVLKEAGVKHIVFLSNCWQGLPMPPNAIQSSHGAAEEAIKAAGFTFTFLRPDTFASNAFRWKYSIAKGEIIAALPDSPNSIIAIEDIAAVAVEALTSNSLDNKIINIIGQEILTVRERIAIISKVLGKPIKVQVVSEEEWRKAMEAHIPAAFIEALFVYDRWRKENGGETQNRNVDKTVIGWMKFEQYIEKHKEEFNVGR